MGEGAVGNPYIYKNPILNSNLSGLNPQKQLVKEMKTNNIKLLAKKLYNIIPPSILIIGSGLIAFGISIYDISIMNTTGASVIERTLMLTGMATMWVVFLLGISVHLTLWTDLDDIKED